MNRVFFLLVFVSICNLCFADNGEVVEVPMTQNPTHNRSQISLPTVDYSVETGSLIIEFESEESYVLEVEDANGINWYSGALNTSGTPTMYYVNLPSHNTYLIRISSANDSFYGILEL